MVSLNRMQDSDNNLPKTYLKKQYKYLSLSNHALTQTPRVFNSHYLSSPIHIWLKLLGGFIRVGVGVCLSECFRRLCPKQWHPSVPPGCVRLTLAVIVGRIPRAGTATQRKCLFSLTDLNAIWLSVANSVVLIQEMISPENFKKEGGKDSYFIHHFSSTSCCSAGGLATAGPTVIGFAEAISLLPTKTHTRPWI